MSVEVGNLDKMTVSKSQPHQIQQFSRQLCFIYWRLATLNPSFATEISNLWVFLILLRFAVGRNRGPGETNPTDTPA